MEGEKELEFFLLSRTAVRTEERGVSLLVLKENNFLLVVFSLSGSENV